MTNLHEIAVISRQINGSFDSKGVDKRSINFVNGKWDRI